MGGDVKVLKNQIEAKVKTLIQKIADDHGVQIIVMETDEDHIQHYLPNLIKAFKGTSARFLFLEHPEVKTELWGGHLWNPSYFVATVSEHSEQQIKEYIRSQKIK